MIDTSTVPEIPTQEWFDAVEADTTLTKQQKKWLADRGQALVAKNAAHQTLKTVEATRAQLSTHPDDQEPPTQPLHTDPDRAILHAAKKLHTLVEKHTRTPDGTRTGNINTLMDYVLAHIFLLEGVKLSKKPLHDLRNIHTETHAEQSGISHRNLAFIWKALCSIEKSKQLPIGNEPRLADLATNMTKQAERLLKQEQEAQETLTPTQRKNNRNEHLKAARKAMFPNLNTTDIEANIPVGEIYRQVQKAENDAKSGENNLWVQESGGEEQGEEIADRGPGTGGKKSKLYKENERLIKKLSGQG